MYYTEEDADAMVEFPYQRKFLPSPQEMVSSFKNVIINVDKIIRVRGTIYKGVKYNGKAITIDARNDDYRKFDCVADHYTEEQRISAVGINRGENSINFWKNKYNRRICMKGIGKGDLSKVRDKIWKSAEEVNHFIPTRTIGVLMVTYNMMDGVWKDVGNVRVLDPCAGWGDRALACAMLKNVKYVGYDPNPELRSGYDRIQNDFSNVTLVTMPFEDSNIEKESFDRIITSPPFYDHEIYNINDPNQSINRYKTYNEWVEKFLYVMLDKCTNALVPGGYMAIHIINSRRMRSGVESTLEYLRQNGKFEYQGTIGFECTKSAPSPMHVWRKKL